MKNNFVYDIFVRYGILILLGFFISGIYFIFTPLTVYPVYFFLSFLDAGTELFVQNIILYEGNYAQIIPACVAGAAYYLLAILNLTTPMKIKKRFYSLCFLIGSFLFLNILRIVFFINILDSQYFDFTHITFWYFGSTILVAILWFVNVYLFKIEKRPIIEDFVNLVKLRKKSIKN